MTSSLAGELARTLMAHLPMLRIGRIPTCAWLCLGVRQHDDSDESVRIEDPYKGFVGSWAGRDEAVDLGRLPHFDSNPRLEIIESLLKQTHRH